MNWHYGGFRPYVSVAERRAAAVREVAKRTKKGQVVLPVRIEGRIITSTFWGQAWCTNLEGYSDFANRLPRGRSYVRNGSVVDLKIESGRIKAFVSGSELYEIQIDIAALPRPKWKALKERCAGQIGTLVELLQGKLSKAVMELVTDRDRGLFPKPNEITMRCSCPDYAGMCKHVAATMYGVGHRLDSAPELLFVLRAVDHLELIEQAIPATPVGIPGSRPTVASADLGAIFDIEIGEVQVASADTESREKPATKKIGKKAHLGAAASAMKYGRNSKKVSTVKKKKATAAPRKG
jgi:uncharacterized Zn finger protein